MILVRFNTEISLSSYSALVRTSSHKTRTRS